MADLNIVTLFKYKGTISVIPNTLGGATSVPLVVADEVTFINASGHPVTVVFAAKSFDGLTGPVDGLYTRAIADGGTWETTALTQTGGKFGDWYNFVWTERSKDFRLGKHDPGPDDTTPLLGADNVTILAQPGDDPRIIIG